MTIPHAHPTLTIAGIVYDMSHLNAFSITVHGKGREPGSDLQVFVTFSSHVFTGRSLYGQTYDIIDHRGTKRTFDRNRYNMSRQLPTLITQHCVNDALCYVSKDFGGHQNLMMEWGQEDRWSVVFCFQPWKEGIGMEILSLHPRSARSVRGKPKRNSLIYFARKCLFQQHRVPEN